MLPITNKAIILWNIPNLLSIYRLLASPALAYCLHQKQTQTFALLFSISLITDILDGWIARTFHLESELGAKLDSWADTATYIVGFCAVFTLKWQMIAPYVHWLFAFLAAWATLYLTMFIKFRGVVGLHTYSFKITAYLQGACMISLLWFGFWQWLFYLSIGWGILSCVEEIIIVMHLQKERTNVKGLFWLLREEADLHNSEEARA